LVGAFIALTNTGTPFVEFQNQCLGVVGNHLVTNHDLIKIPNSVAGNQLEHFAVVVL
jgi:hypothetical protein